MIKETDLQQIRGSHSPKSWVFKCWFSWGPVSLLFTFTVEFSAGGIIITLSGTFSIKFMRWGGLGRYTKNLNSPFGWRTTDLLITENLVDVNASSLWEPRELEAAVRDGGGACALARLCWEDFQVWWVLQVSAKDPLLRLRNLLFLVYCIFFFFFKSRRAVEFYQMLFFRLRWSCVFH